VPGATIGPAGRCGATHETPESLTLKLVGVEFLGARGGAGIDNGMARMPLLTGRALARPMRLAALLVLVVIVQISFAAPPSGATEAEVGPTPGASGLPDGRVYEQVSPADKHGYEAGAHLGVEGAQNAYGVASPDGSRILYWSSGPIGEASSGVANYSESVRTGSGWSTKSALPEPAPEPRDPISPNDPGWLLPSADLSSVAFTAHNPFAPAPLDFSNPDFSFDSTYLSSEVGPAMWLGKPAVDDPFPALEEVEESADLVLVGASADLSVLYYEYYGTLLEADAPRRTAVAEGNDGAWGLYEWREGQLKAAGVLPSGEEDEDGAVAAAVGLETERAVPADFDNEVSRSGNTMLFVSPSPRVEGAPPPQLYARLEGKTLPVLVSRSELTGEAASGGVLGISGLSSSGAPSFAYGSPDGSHVFFASEERLTAEAPAAKELDEYEFDFRTGVLRYMPGVTAPILASNEDGSTLVFYDTKEHKSEMAVFSGGHVTEIAAIHSPSSPLYLSPVRLDADGRTLVFQTNAPITGFNNGEGLGEVYRYDFATNGLSCISCPPQGLVPTGSASLSSDDVPSANHVVRDSRGISEDGEEIFFDTPEPLVPQDTNGARDVYEWRDGHLSLISAGSGPGESVFLDNSASGSDVFFATTENLSGSDTDGSFDVYDARVGGGFPAGGSSSSCAAACGGGASQSQSQLNLASTSVLGAGEQAVNPAPPPNAKQKPLSRAQKLAKSLRVCKRKRDRSRRRACEALARRRYGKHVPRRHA
jgi:hypothetical protein